MAGVFFGTLAKAVLAGRGALRGAAIKAVEQFADQAEALTPVEFGDLHNNAHPTVLDQGAVVYDRPPRIPGPSYEQKLSQRRGRRRGLFG